MHVYDVLAGDYLGHLKTVHRKVQPGPVQLLTALPYEVVAVSVKPARKTAKQGRKFKFTASILAKNANPGMHILRIVLTDPKGTIADTYTTNARAEQGVFQGGIPLAINDKPGNWTITATDVVSGKTGHATFTVKENR